MFIAVCSGNRVLEVASSEAASLEGVAAYASLGYPLLGRLACGARESIAFGHGRELFIDHEYDADASKLRPLVKVLERGSSWSWDDRLGWILTESERSEA
jgi:hypothetical protein